MIYNYDKLKAEYGKYYKANNEVCEAKFNMTIEELRDKQNKTEDEKREYEAFVSGCPVNVSPSVINRIAWHIEKHFADKDLFDVKEFNIDKLKTPNINYSTTMYNRVKKLKEEYDNDVHIILQNMNKGYLDVENKTSINLMLREQFKDKIIDQCNTIEECCNIMIDICYSDKNSKDLLWDMFGEQIIKNLIANGYDKLRFPTKNEDGDIIFKGIKFRMEEVDANGIKWK